MARYPSGRVAVTLLCAAGVLILCTLSLMVRAYLQRDPGILGICLLGAWGLHLVYRAGREWR